MLLGARSLNRSILVLMYVLTAVAVAVGALPPSVAVVVVALRARCPSAAGDVRAGAGAGAAPAGCVGWPLWYHRVCLVHNRAFGWLFILGAAAGAIWPAASIGR